MKHSAKKDWMNLLILVTIVAIICTSLWIGGVHAEAELWAKDKRIELMEAKLFNCDSCYRTNLKTLVRDSIKRERKKKVGVTYEVKDSYK